MAARGNKKKTISLYTTRHDYLKTLVIADILQAHYTTPWDKLKDISMGLVFMMNHHPLFK